MAAGDVIINRATMTTLKRSSLEDAVFDQQFVTTGTHTNFQVAVEATFTGDGGDYLIVAMGTVDIASLSVDYTVELFDDVTDTSYGQSLMRARDLAERLPWGTMIKRTSVSGSQTFQVRIKSSSGSDSARIDGAAILIFKLNSANHHYAESLGTTSHTSSSTWANKCELVITDASAGDWLILACAQVYKSGTGAPKCRVVDDMFVDEYLANAYINPIAASKEHSIFYSGIRTLAANDDKTFRIEFQTSFNAQSVSCKNAVICAINLSVQSQTHTGSVTFSGSGSITPTAVLNAQASLSVTGAATVSPDEVLAAQASWSPAGAATAFWFCGVVRQGQTTFSGAGTFTAEATDIEIGSVTMSGAAVFTPDADLNAQASLSLAGAGTFTADGTRVATGSQSLTGVATFTVTGVGAFQGSFNPQGAATFIGTGVRVQTASWNATGVATTTWTADTGEIGEVTFNGASTATFQGVLTAQAATTLTGGSTFNAASSRVQTDYERWTGTSTFTTAGNRVQQTTFSPEGAASFTATATQIFGGSVSWSGAATLTAIGGILALLRMIEDVRVTRKADLLGVLRLAARTNAVVTPKAASRALISKQMADVGKVRDLVAVDIERGTHGENVIYDS